MTEPEIAPEMLVTVFERLFENEFASLDGISISSRSGAGMNYIDESVAIQRMLAEESDFQSFEPNDPNSYAIHRAIYASRSDAQSVVSGWSRHLRALLLEGMALPTVTSMMRKRGVADLRDHLFEAEALLAPNLDETLARAAETTERNDMAHMLIVASNGVVTVAAPTPIEAMVHWHNVEFAAKVECIRVEEVSTHV